MLENIYLVAVLLVEHTHGIAGNYPNAAGIQWAIFHTSLSAELNRLLHYEFTKIKTIFLYALYSDSITCRTEVTQFVQNGQNQHAKLTKSRNRNAFIHI